MDARSEKLIQDVRVLVRDAEDLIRATAGEIGDQTREARARLAGALVVARETCNRLEQKNGMSSTNADLFVRSRPYHAIAAGFGLGVFAGALLVRATVSRLCCKR